MINILSVNCGLVFAPYLVECARSYLHKDTVSAKVIRQGGTGLIIRADDLFSVRYQNREAVLSIEDVRHYSETLEFRLEFYDVQRTSDELVFASIGRSLLVSYPQSDLWLEPDTVARLIAIFDRGSLTQDEEINDAINLPDWLSVSSSAGRLLLSDQRNGRWSLLGSDHMAELERRLEALNQAHESVARPQPPTVSLKGVVVHLQSAFRLAAALESFAERGEVLAFEEIAPTFQLKVSKATEGIEVRDSTNRVGLTAREARKWAAIIRAELARVNATFAERGSIRTVFADGQQGRWVLQWGDEVFVPARMLNRLSAEPEGMQEPEPDMPVIKRTANFLLLLSSGTGGCVALTEEEVDLLAPSKAASGDQ